MRIHEQCGRNVTPTAQCLRMHRRSLQRILGKRAPQLRADTTMSEPPVTGFRRQSCWQWFGDCPEELRGGPPQPL